MTRIEPPEWATQPDLSVTGVTVAEYATVQRHRDKLLRAVHREVEENLNTPGLYGEGESFPDRLRMTDGRLTIDNAAAEQAIRPLCVGRRNWLHSGGDGGLQPSAILLSIAASVKRHGLDPWAYLTRALSALPTRPPGGDLGDLLPDAWAKSRGETHRRVG